jgi:glycosyltransferase involved in cell wall biosynthesis
MGMHVGLVVYGDLDTLSGGFRYDRRLVASLRAHGDRVTVLELPWRSYPRGLLDNADPRVADRIARAGPFDLLLQDELAHPSLVRANRRLRGRLDCPLVGIVHHLRADETDGPARRAYEAIEGRYLRSLDAVVTNSEPTLSSVRRLASPERTLVAPPAGDRFDPDVDEAAIGRRARRDPPRALALGTVTPRKATAALVDAVAAARTPWELTVVGDTTVDPGYVRRCRRLADRRGIADRVTFAGAIDDDALADRLRASHVLALPSRHEGFGIAYLEGMAFGLPAVASLAGGGRSVVTHGETGLLVPPAGAGAVAAALDRLAADRTELARMGRAARRRFEAHPGWAETGARTRAFLAELAGGDPVDSALPPEVEA